MRVVGFDTATEDTSVCAWDEGEVIEEITIGPANGQARPAHATALLPAIERAAEAAGGWRRVDRIAAGTGPGSFTGLRIGLATARGLGAALSLQAVGVGTLDALARGMRETGDGGRELLAALDARRGELFACLYDPAGSPLREPFLADPGELTELVSGRARAPLAAGSGALRFRREISGGGAEIPRDSDPVHRIAARHVCALGAGSGGHGELEPRYLRRPDAERWRERDPSRSQS